MPTLAPDRLSGALVVLMLGLIGRGGSILAVPMLIYVVGITSTHVEPQGTIDPVVRAGLEQPS